MQVLAVLREWMGAKVPHKVPAARSFANHSQEIAQPESRDKPFRSSSSPAMIKRKVNDILKQSSDKYLTAELEIPRGLPHRKGDFVDDERDDV